MTTRVLPTLTDGTTDYIFTTTLDGGTYRFQFDFNDRDGFWYFLLLDANGVQLCSRKVVVGYSLIGRFTNVALPPGCLAAIDTSGQMVEAGLNNLGARVLLLYFERADLP